MGGKMSRNKGAAGEREAAKALNDLFGWDAKRGCQHAGGFDAPDIKGLPGRLHVEVKRVEALHLWQALDQAKADAGPDGCPFVMHRPNKKPWIVIVELDHLPELVKTIAGKSDTWEF